MQAVESLAKIGTFEVLNEHCVVPFAVRDRCEFNNWGVEFFRDEDKARRYADWADRFKHGRTSAEFQG